MNRLQLKKHAQFVNCYDEGGLCAELGPGHTHVRQIKQVLRRVQTHDSKQHCITCSSSEQMMCVQTSIFISACYLQVTNYNFMAHLLLDMPIGRERR